jgi:hypothetical protein
MFDWDPTDIVLTPGALESVTHRLEKEVNSGMQGEKKGRRKES